MTTDSVITPLGTPPKDWYSTLPTLRTTIMLFIMSALGGCTVWFWRALNHLHLPLRKRLKPLRENDALFVLGCFPTVYRAFNPTPGFVFLSSVMCKNVILPYHDPNMQPFIQRLPVFICSASVRLSASCHEYLKWNFEWLNTGSNSLFFFSNENYFHTILCTLCFYFF